jgi:hypothetical protein
VILAGDIYTSCFVPVAMIFSLIAFIDFSPSLVIGVFELINPNLHLPQDFPTFLLLMTPGKMPKHPSKPVKAPLVYLSSLLLLLKAKLTHR